MSMLFFKVLLNYFWSSWSTGLSSLLVLLLIILNPSASDFSPLKFFPFMSLTAGHLSTPFWCFAVPGSSSHPPVHNPLCAHQTERASAGHREGEMRIDLDLQMQFSL